MPSSLPVPPGTPLPSSPLASTRRRGVLIGFVMVLASLVANATLTYLNLRRLDRNAALVNHSYDVLIQLNQLLGTITDAETGQRGYLISGDTSFLQNYDLAQSTVYNRLGVFGNTIHDNPTQRAHFAELVPQVERRMQLMSENVKLRQAGGNVEVRRKSDVIAGRRSMEGIRLIVAKIEQEEMSLLKLRTSESRVSYWTALITGFITAGMGLALVCGGYVLLTRDFARREHAAAALEQEKNLLEDRVRERTGAISDANAALRAENEERRRAEENAQQIAQELKRSNQELEQFASVASHDLQEPLRKIQAFGDRLQAKYRAELGEVGQDYLDRMLFSAGRMRKLIDDLLTFSRVASKAQPFVTVDLAQIAREVASDLEGRLHETGGTLEIGDLPALQADPLQMRQMLQNLLGNSLKFHRPQVPPRVQVSSRLINSNGAEGASSSEPKQCEISFQDNGIGFDSVYADRIFNLFQRLHSRTEYEGTGMGLAICRKIAERHGGHITVSSVPDQGTRFVVTLPLEQAHSGITGVD